MAVNTSVKHTTKAIRTFNSATINCDNNKRTQSLDQKNVVHVGHTDDMRIYYYET
jgi:hypothetical protein